jgi:Ca2+-binding EF-hand superfamily protein
MLGFEAERRLKNFLVAVSDGERDLELARTRLCNIPDFVPRAAFERVDRTRDGTVTSGEIGNFLRDNGIFHVSESEAYNLVGFFDGNGDKRLTYDEFVQMFLPCEDNYLRDRALSRYAPTVLPHELLPRDIESAMSSVIEKEIDLQRRLESLKADLQVCLDYSAYAAFNSVERFTRTGVLTTVNIAEFLRTQGHFASESELVAIVRRIDTNGDGTINSGEFAEFMRPLGGVKPVYASPVRSSSPMRSSSPIRASSPVRVKTTTLLESPVSLNRSLSVERRLYAPLYVSPYRRWYNDPLYSPYYPYYSRYYYGSYWSPTLGRYVPY